MSLKVVGFCMSTAEHNVVNCIKLPGGKRNHVSTLQNHVSTL